MRTYIQADRQTYRQTYIHTYIHTYVCTYVTVGYAVCAGDERVLECLELEG